MVRRLVAKPHNRSGAGTTPLELLGCKAGPIMIKQFQIIEVVPSAACNQRRARTKCSSVLASSTAAADAKAFCSVAASACRKMEQTGQIMLGCIEVIWHVVQVSR